MKATTPKALVLQTGRNLLILGDGYSAPADLAAFLALEIPHDTACIGRSIKLCDDARHWFNADSDPATVLWARQLKRERPGLVTHTLGAVDGFDVDWDVEQPDYRYEEITNHKGRLHGSSALFATLAGLAMGYEGIVLAGCPLDSDGHWYWDQRKETFGPLWLGQDFMAWLDFATEPEAAKVRSMSGYTARILGKADRR